MGYFRTGDIPIHGEDHVPPPVRDPWAKPWWNAAETQIAALILDRNPDFAGNSGRCVGRVGFPKIYKKTSKNNQRLREIQGDTIISATIST